MKLKFIPLLPLTCCIHLLCSCSTAHAGWFSDSKELEAQKQKTSAVEEELDVQRRHLSHWQMTSASLAVTALLLFGIGTALGAKTRRHHHASTPLT